MYLKRIEIAGFKSFADRTVIEFNQGLTAVVGPNGSGKSNITEAIRWVLGEQSAKNLRGGKMPDVIFAGSSSRSALNLAEVTLVLDNEEHFLPIDFSEVSITRRLTRNGDSDFFINKQACRMKDVVNLFMDSGLGKESFSIISQGKVEAIFNSKPEDRRGIFEEAAGVLKYKTRKKEAEKKLFETEDNLNRVQDIIYELETQLTPLETQSKTAKTYLNLKEQLTEVDVAVTVHDIESNKSVWDDKNNSLNDMGRDISKFQQELDKHEVELVALKDERDRIDEAIETQQRVLLEVTTKYEQLEGRKNVLEERQKYSVQNKESYQETLTQLTQKIEQLTLLIDTYKRERDQHKKAEKELLTDVKELKRDVERYSKSTKEQLADLRSEYVEVMQQQTNVNNDLKHLEKQYQQEINRNQKDVATYDQLQESEKATYQEKERIEKEKVTQTTLVESLLTEHEQKQQEYNTLKQQVQGNERQMYEALRILQQAQARQKSLQDLQENYAGFYQGVRAVLKEKDHLNGIVGAVAEMIEVPKEVSLAIETALGAAAQHVITQDEKSARAAITFLKQKKVGRATFLPLTTIKPRQITSHTLAQVTVLDGFVGVASELISFDLQIQSVVQNLLGVTLIAKNLTSANALAKQVNYKYRIVSLDGDVMNPGGSMTGGANKKGQSNHLFSQSSELKQLDGQVVQMERLYQAKEEDVRALKETYHVLESSLEDVRKRGEEARFKEQMLTNQLEQLTHQHIQQEKECRAFEYEKKELQRFLENYEEEKEQLLEAKDKLIAKRDALDKMMSETDEQEEENHHKKEIAQNKLTTCQSELAVLSEKIAQISRSISEKTHELKASVTQRDDMLAQLDTESLEQLNHEELNERIEQEMVQYQKTREDTSLMLMDMKDKRELLYTKIAELDKGLTEKNKEIQEKIDAKTAIEVSKNRSDIALDTALTYLQEEYGLTYEAGCHLYPAVTDLDESKAKIKELKETIQSLGVVNLQSVEQFEDVSKRYDFLVSQRDDLVLAKDELFETMTEMDELVIKKFHEVFCDIREEFKIVFPNMFGGGHADLILTDPSDLLHTGIDIVAQPPGKKLQNLSLLSGGERALTAIALLFAIIQARPVPFCILDEVEAALDDANVKRFGDYLRHFDDDTQFIVITHRKGTMESANMLYGVTMQESGVSKIVSVHLEELEERMELTNDAKK